MSTRRRGRRAHPFSGFADDPERILWAALALGLIHGLLYVFLVPPWQHYDEPNHFEYAALLARKPPPVTEADVDPRLRDAILASMAQNQFFDRLNAAPTWINIAQFVDPPLYHWVAGGVVRLFPGLGVTDQLYLMRLVSLAFLLASIAAAWAAAAEVTRPGHPLRWMTPLFLALLPGFVDLMTAVNNDSLAVALSCLFLWVSLRLVCRGWRWNLVLVLLASAFLAYYTKKTTLILGGFAPLVLALVLAPPRRRWMVWAGSAALAVFGLAALLQGGDARDWIRQTEQPVRTRAQKEALPGQPYAFQLQAAPGEIPVLWQNLPFADAIGSRGKTVTVGGWVWASRPVKALSPGVRYHNVDKSVSDVAAKEVNVTQAPQYVTLEVPIPETVNRVLLALYPLNAPQSEPVTVYYTGLFLVEGTCPVGEIPRFSATDGSAGDWCGKPFRNMARNANALYDWPAPREAVFQRLGGLLPVTRTILSEWIAYSIDRQGFQWYDGITRLHLFHTFWAQFGWGNVPLRHPVAYTLLWVVTLAAGVGLLILLWAYRKVWRQTHISAVLLVILFGLVGWMVAFVAGIYFGGARSPTVVPVARYAYPVIVPTALAITAGWWAWFRLFEKKFPSIQNRGVLLYLLLWISFDLYSLASILSYFK